MIPLDTSAPDPYPDIKPAPPKPVPGRIAREMSLGLEIALKHQATGIWVGPLVIVGLTLSCGHWTVYAKPRDAKQGDPRPPLVLDGGYGDGTGQWKFADEVSIESRADRQRDAILRRENLTPEEFRAVRGDD